MIELRKVGTIKAHAAEVWETVRDFNGLPRFMSLVAGSTIEGSGIGAVRTLTLADGHIVVETLEELDNEAMFLRYSLLDDPTRPFGHYMARMKVTSLDENHCGIEFLSTFEAQGNATVDEAKEGPAAIYASGIEGLQRLHEHPPETQ